jgi:hypothetical protein
MTDSKPIVIKVPAEIPSVKTDGTPNEPVANKHTGQVTVPAQWTGADWQAYHEASLPVSDERPDHQWLRQWRWAKERVLEWELKDFPTNPNQIDDGKVRWPLVSFLTGAIHGAMLDYLGTSKHVIDTLTYPEPYNLHANELFAWEKEVREAKGEDVAPLLQTWRTGRVIIRQWANGTEPARDGLDVDLALIGAVNEIVGDTMTVALDLGNSRGPRGRP